MISKGKSQEQKQGFYSQIQCAHHEAKESHLMMSVQDKGTDV